MAESGFLEVLKVEHPIYAAQKDLWQRNETRMLGGDPVLAELRRFDWEDAAGEPFTARKQSATYVNFGLMYADMLVGHLNRHKPQPDKALSFGTMGTIVRPNGATQPTRAELAYYNIDGVGNDGSEWDNFWFNCVRLACATGHRWIYVDAPEAPGVSFEDEINGMRPYLVEYSPTAVNNWHYERGQLAMAVLKLATRAPRIDTEGKLTGNDYQPSYLLLTRTGFEGFGARYARGGWFRFTADGDLEAEGDWASTGGAIPMFPLFYQRAKPSATQQTMSRPAVTELCNVSVSYMNLSSAADFDAWDAAQSLQFLEGVDDVSHNLAVAKMGDGSRLVPLKPVMVGDTVVVPHVADSSGSAVPEGIFKSRLDTKREEARELAAREVTTAGDASGVARQAAHTEVKSPRLALVASELEAAQRTAIHLLEQRNNPTAKPSGNVTWTRDFDLIEVREQVETFFRIQNAAGIKSSTLTTMAVLAAADDLNLLTDDTTRKKVEAELTEDARLAAERAAQAADIESQFGIAG